MIVKQNDTSEIQQFPERFPIGACRLWRRRCFTEGGYIIGKSADALSTASARTKGWHAQALRSCHFTTREMGAVEDRLYYGRTYYYRYVPFYFIIAKYLWYTIRGHRKIVRGYIFGFLDAWKKKDRGNIPPKVKMYFLLLPLQILRENIIVARNKSILQKKLQDRTQ